MNTYKFHRSALLSVIAMLFILARPVQSEAADPISRMNFFFDTVITITIFDSEDETILDDCNKLMARYESLFSRTVEGSDIWNINHSEGKSVTVSDETADILKKALHYCELSDGAFDITIAPVVSLWDFHEDSERIIPSEESVAEAVSHVDYHIVTLEGNTVTLSDPKGAVDLGAIAKGYISDGLRDLLLSRGVKSALIDLGGNIMSVGSKQDGSPWRIGIRKPFAGMADLIDIAQIRSGSVITSGSYERYFIVDDVLYHHILDPDTGFPVKNDLTSVSILSENGSDGDALSTTCFVLGEEKGMDLIESLDGIEALFITKDEQKKYSSGWGTAAE